MRYRSFPKDGEMVCAVGMGWMRFPLKDGAVDRAAAIALRCAGLWEDYTPIDRQCSGGALTEPAAEHETAYRLLRQRYRAARRALESFTQENQNIPSM